MKKIAMFLLPAAILAATPAMATPVDSFTGVRVEATAGVDDVTRIPDVTDITYGAAVGIDTKLTDNVIVGVEGGFDNVFERTDVAASARLGYAFNENVLGFVKVGYTDFRGLEGIRMGGGVEVNVTNDFYVKAEGRFTEFGGGLERVQGLVGVGVRF